MNALHTYRETGELLILGSGESAVGAALLAKAKGWRAFVSEHGEIAPASRRELEAAGIPYEENGHSEAALQRASLVIKSPGIPQEAPIVRSVRANFLPLISEIEFGYHYCPGKIIGVTGTNGKTTTVRLIQHILQCGGVKSCLCGNIGNSFCRELATQPPFHWYVLEISSFQLDDVVDFHPHIAVITNLSPNHLNRYNHDFSAYANAKLNLLRNQTAEDYLIYSLDSPLLTEALEGVEVRSQPLGFSLAPQPGAATFIDNHFIRFTMPKNKKKRRLPIDAIKLQGEHNRYNVMAASLVGDLVNVRNENIRDSLSEFENSPHRLEEVGKIEGVTFINDSKATNVNAAWYALRSTNADIIWIAGGVDKGNDYGELLEIVKEKVKGLIMIGKDTARLEDSFNGHIKFLLKADSMDEALKKAWEIATEGDNVLLSPACASFDQFENYEERGEAFRKAFKKRAEWVEKARRSGGNFTRF